MNKILGKVCCFTAVITLMAGMTSCDNWLDMPELDKYDATTIFSSVERADMATLGSYAGLWNLMYNYYPTYGTDEAQSSESTSGSKNSVGNYVYTTANVPSSEFNNHYQCISRANICIKNIPLMGIYTSGTEAEKTHLRKLVGENLVIRAVHYLNLIRYWGDVPYITLPQEDYPSQFSSRTSRDIIYDGIIADMQQAIDLLPWYSQAGTTNERFTKNSAYGMLARTALYAAGYSLRWDLTSYSASTMQMSKRSDVARVTALNQIASDACEAIINQGENNLNPSFESLFRTYSEGTYYPSESMFEYAQYGSTNNTCRAGYSYGMRSVSGNMFGKAEPLAYYLPTLYYAYGNEDLRRDVTCPNYEIMANGVRSMTPLYNRKSMGKWRVNWKVSAAGQTSVMYQNINVVLLRYSDILLMFAEAQNELNNAPTDKAKLAFEKVRTRAYGNDASKIGTTPTTHDTFLKAIVEERKLEFAFEGWRRTDLIRWNLLGEVVAETKANLIKMAKREAPYDRIPEWVAYPKEIATTFKDPSVTLKKVIEVFASDTATFVLPANYTLLKNYISSSNWKTAGAATVGLHEQGDYISNFVRGFEANKVELFPIAQTIMDTNKGLTGQQQPKY